MSKWHLKAALQGGMSLFPFSRRMNYVFQKHVTRSLQHNRADFDARLDVAHSHLEFYSSHVGGLPTAVLELGSG
jgi:hypothetical protein